MFIYSVKFVCGTQNVTSTVPQACTPVRQGTYSTEINIHNFNKTAAVIEKRVLLLVQNDAPVGREPQVIPAKPFEKITLPPDSATMDDCCHLGDKLGFNPAHINIGFLEILSNVELNVTAVYTATDLKAATISIDVETFNSRSVS
jgi:hypothetical protein